MTPLPSAILVAAAHLLAASALAQPAPVSLQGRLSGVAAGPHTLDFFVYDDPAGGAPRQSTLNVPVAVAEGGVFTTALTLDASAGWLRASTFYVGITVDDTDNTPDAGHPELVPRLPWTPAPTAMSLVGELRTGRVAGFPGEGQIGESDWGTFLIARNDDDRHLRLGVSNDGYTKAQIRLDNSNERWGRIEFWTSNDDAPPINRMVIDEFGRVGIGEPQPQATLDVNGSVHAATMVLGGTTRAFDLDVNGGTRTGTLTITGGADLAERLSVTDPDPADAFPVEPGMVVSIDPAGSRAFKLADEPYDRKRVGVISGGNGLPAGLVLHHAGNPDADGGADGGRAVALTGQVWCHADAADAPILPGDLLTTSSVPGHAMKATDLDRARFAVVGQALSPLHDGRGWVLVLVGKQ